MKMDMTTGNPMKLIIKFSVPMILGNVFQQFYNIADSLIVGRFVGVDALAAIGNTSSIIFLLLGIVSGMTSGFSILIAQCFGAKKEDELRHYFGVSIVLCAILTIILTGGMLFLLHPILDLINTPAEIYQQSYRFLYIIIAGTVTMTVFNMISGVLRAVGDSRNPLIILIIASVANVVLNYVFVVIMQLNVSGSAYATVCSQGLSSVLACGILVFKYPFLKLKLKEITFSLKSAVRLLGLGIPMALQFSITAIGTTIVQTAINGLGPVYIAAFSTAGKIQTIIAQAFAGLGAGMASYTGQNIGAGNWKRIEQGVRDCFKLSLGFGILGGVFVFFFGDTLVGYFMVNPSKEVLLAGKEFFYIVAAFYPILSLIFLYRNTLQGLGEGLVPMMGGIFELLARGICVLLFAKTFGYQGICFAHPFAWASALIILLPYYYWKMKKMRKELAL